MDQVTKKLIDGADHIIVIGLPAAGKTTFIEKHMNDAEANGYKIFHTDDYMKKYSYEESLYVIISDVRRYDIEHGHSSRWIVEGIQGYRLARKIAQGEADLRLDMIIDVQANQLTREARYKDRGKPFPYGTDKNLATVWAAFKALRHGAKILTVSGEEE